MQIDQLLNADLSPKQVLELGANINKLFRKNYVGIFLTHSQNKSNSKEILATIRNELFSNHKLQIIKYRSSLLVIINFDDRIIYDSTRLFIKKILGKHGPLYKMGVSNIYKKKSEFHRCIKEALSAFEYCQEINTNLVQYSDVEIYRLLLSISNTELLKEYFHKYIAPLQTNHQSGLLETMEVFIEFDGDIKKTAKYFDQHENTVRYRISKAKKILNLEQNHLKFIEIVSIGIKIKHIFEDIKEKIE
jgi:sugar diacid utilization regulator